MVTAPVRRAVALIRASQRLSSSSNTRSGSLGSSLIASSSSLRWASSLPRDEQDDAPATATTSTPRRTKLADVLVSDVLRAKHSHRYVEPVISKNASVKEAIVTVIEGGLSAMMVLDDTHNNNNSIDNNNTLKNKSRRVAGLLTSRDLLRIMASAVQEGISEEDLLNRLLVGEYMTPISQVVFGRPEETVGMLRAIMSKLGIKCIPILSKDGRVEGVLTARDINDFAVSATEKGGKKQYLKDISQRVGLSSTTSMAEPPIYIQKQLSLDQRPLYVTIGQAELPHPLKSINGSDPRKQVYTSDKTLSEDASFVSTVTLPSSRRGATQQYTYVGVADGVGSWREYNVDPRAFSHALMEECTTILEQAAKDDLEHNMQQEEEDDVNAVAQHAMGPLVIPPAQLMGQAYERVKQRNIIGSCTACIALFDSARHQLHFSNLGDSGLILLRHIDSDVAGSLKRERVKPRTERQSDLQVSFVSQQQLRSFNHPYQLGWTGEEISELESSSFKTAKESCNTSLHVRRGDIIIMATDGLFDNVDLDEICSIVVAWEERYGFIRQGDSTERNRRWASGNSMVPQSVDSVTDLADQLCERARANSLNKDLDSPFAILAKENDIMWSGGMPDDCTVVALHIVGRDSDDGI